MQSNELAQENVKVSLYKQSERDPNKLDVASDEQICEPAFNYYLLLFLYKI